MYIHMQQKEREGWEGVREEGGSKSEGGREGEQEGGRDGGRGEGGKGRDVNT